MKTMIGRILAVLFIIFCFSGCQKNFGTGQAEQISGEIQQTTTIAEQTEQTTESPDTFETTLSETETETSAEAEPTENTFYTIDPETAFTMDCYDDEAYINLPMFVSHPEGSDANVYVMLADESKQWQFYEDMFYINYPTTEYVIIEHDGIVDEIPCKWATRFREPFEIYSGDYDGDGEIEIAAVRYSVGGTFCNVNQLSVFKLIDGHYQCYMLDNHKIIECIAYGEMDENNTVEFTIKNLNGPNVSFIMDINTPESFFGIPHCGDIIGYSVDRDKITVNVGILSMYDTLDESAELTMTVNFSDGEFTFSEPVFEIYG